MTMEKIPTYKRIGFQVYNLVSNKVVFTFAQDVSMSTVDKILSLINEEK